jgi:redox-sensitive bicupin YhaK (pirin superfamily)
MSWMPSQDPVLGDQRSCDALELVIVPRARDLGGFEVRRALPHGKRQMVGPFIFFDQMGPVQFVAGHGMDVRPHPHIGLATVTYLFDGRVVHRDSEGNALEITPGAMNLMTAGRGIVHSERTPPDARANGQQMFGIQSWIALPAGKEEIDPAFEHFDAASLPLVEASGVTARIIAGSAFGRTSPVGMVSDWLYAEVLLAPGTSAPLDPDHEERAIYVVTGEVEIAGQRFEGPRLLIFRPGDRITVRAKGGGAGETATPVRLMFMGGAAMEGPRYIWWNFVSSRRELIEQAKEDWKTGRFAPVPGESEFIPLPE